MATKMVATWRIDLEPIRARGIIVKYTVHLHPQSIQKCVVQPSILWSGTYLSAE